MNITEIPANQTPMHLLLLADPDATCIRSYLPMCRAFVIADPPVGVLLLRPRTARVWEIMNLAVDPLLVRKGLGSRLISHAIRIARGDGARCIEVGTGNSSLGPLAFYRSHGFRVVRVIEGHFDSYSPPIIENGNPCRDLVRLELLL